MSKKNTIYEFDLKRACSSAAGTVEIETGKGDPANTEIHCSTGNNSARVNFTLNGGKTANISCGGCSLCEGFFRSEVRAENL